ncbi:S9 family peptidase [Bacillus horti]|uniref:Dipeptidyl aminopeptidase/acylaminoacyl peptidase n=1 Tax=Caldalkalibacillus horti TaxID=77523 RepID=A0ABT9VW35_9BACI|nr:S9 family peptidase [Bacillus horti]MDQ0165179.1 dipeptidyl aminopeptidase/acylaminoacyl peptidase [Bacillus horti]
MRIEPFLFVKSATHPVYHPTADRVTYLSNMTGIPQVWEYDREKELNYQLSFTSERIMFVGYISGSSQKIIGMDEGVNERQQLYLLHSDSTLTPLTDQPDFIHKYGGASADGKRIAWASNRRNPRFFDIYVQDLESLEFRCVYEVDGSYAPIAWHPQQEALLIEKTNTNLDQDLGLLDLQSGEVKWLTSHNGEAGFYHAHFSQSGDSIFVLTNMDHEYVGLAEISTTTGQLTWLDQEFWDLEKLAINKAKTHVAYSINEGGYSKAVLYRLEDGTKTHWEHPQGVIEKISFSPDGKKLAFVLNGATHPTDLWEYDLVKNETKRLTYVSCSPSVQEELVEPELIEYISFDGLKIPAFYYKPKNTTGPLPVLVFVHGGPESQIRPTYNPFLQYFIHHGYAVCTPNVRGSSGYGKTSIHLDDKRKRMDSVQDLVSLVDWLKAEGDADPKRISIMGRSYGGFMVLAAITHHPDLWAAAIDIVGISSFKSFLQNTSVWRRKLREAEYGSLEEDSDFFDQIDPIHYTDKIKAPLLVLHGANDPRVPVEEAEQIVADLKKRDHPVEYICFENEGHFFVRTENNITAYTEVARFLDRWLTKS